MNRKSLSWLVLGLNGSSLILLFFQAPDTWVHYMAIISSCFACCLNLSSPRCQESTETNEDPRLKVEVKVEVEVTTEDRKAKLKALIEEYKQLKDSVNTKEEDYALAEARLQASETLDKYMEDRNNATLDEEARKASARSSQLRHESERRKLRLRRIWLDIEKLERELGIGDFGCL
ncbi:hypothetical protein L207DRAFT_593255 [Hyaloscypha variabilis F]|uniref:Uncharacterized protein n=1 Tax=Hyaloscypha variabilis (strain UAMH 11265 / GT02V1 / F) TaxID=1149755 RepID=A0A2J6QTU7_HYAVF|nr:hypothetical protein L207DRAFT_593255 [Hyaloscypha variabilis F]